MVKSWRDQFKNRKAHAKNTFEPKCMSSNTQFAVTNKNQLIPCCYVDHPTWINTPDIKKLADVSDITKHKNIESIVIQNEWTDFYRTLKQGTLGHLDAIPEVCLKHCNKISGQSTLMKQNWENDKGEIIRVDEK